MGKTDHLHHESEGEKHSGTMAATVRSGPMEDWDWQAGLQEQGTTCIYCA